MSNTLRQKLKAADRWAENALIGAGHGITNQLEGLYQIGAHPVQFGKGMVALGRNALADPRAFGGGVANALVSTGRRAVSGPLGFGEVVGENLPLNVNSYLRRAPTMREMTVYHGSPHQFDEFDIGKIGTGEGAQAYGHGLYVAESPGVAKSYTAMMPVSGTPRLRRFLFGEELKAGTPEYHAATLMDSPGRTLASVRKEVQSWIDDAATWDAKRLADKGEQAALAGWKRTLETLNKAKKKADFAQEGSGYLYHVDLADEHIAKMLDWDAPLSEQPEAIHEIVRDMLKQQGYLRPNDNGPRQLQTAFKAWKIERAGMAESGKGESIYGLLSKQLGSDEAASNYLRERGIPGIKYWDAGSRAAGEGTRNYVVFDDKLLKVLKRE